MLANIPGHRSYAPLRSWLAAMGAVVLCLSGCGQPPSFRCGVALDSNNQNVTRCSRNLEICVCENNYCAREVSLMECGSGYKYVEYPFVPVGVADTCVDGLLHPSWTVRSEPGSNQLPLCSSTAPDVANRADMSTAR